MEFLNSDDSSSINFEELDVKEAYYFFVKKNYAFENVYNKGVSLKEIFNRSNVGTVISKDRIAIDFTQKELPAKLNDSAGQYYQTSALPSLTMRLPLRLGFLHSV